AAFAAALMLALWRGHTTTLSHFLGWLFSAGLESSDQVVARSQSRKAPLVKEPVPEEETPGAETLN
ncbi:MAG: hypothetical protein R3336_09810, partial [Phycisphaeraceae bacterium]|nr:hypothetical protein [Phycisphaeraceae bacterium]